MKILLLIIGFFILTIVQAQTGTPQAQQPKAHPSSPNLPVGTSTVVQLSADNIDTLEYKWRYPTKKVGRDLIVTVRSDLEIKLPNPKIEFDFNKYPNIKTDLDVARKAFADMFKVYYEAYEEEFYNSYKLPKDFRWLEPVYIGSLTVLSKATREQLRDNSVPLSRFKSSLDEVALRYFGLGMDYILINKKTVETEPVLTEKRVSEMINENDNTLQEKLQTPKAESTNRIKEFIDEFGYIFILLTFTISLVSFVLVIRD
jgi:hypothetical protein